MYPLIMSHYVYFKNKFFNAICIVSAVTNQSKELCHHLWCHVNRNAVSFSQGGAGSLKVMKCLECLGWKVKIFTDKGISLVVLKEMPTVYML